MWLASAELWIVVVRNHDAGRRVRDYTVHVPDGAVFLTGQANNWGRDLRLQTTDGAEGVLLRRRRLFPLTGRIDVFGNPDHHALGTFHRSGRVRRADGTQAGRLHNARSLRSRIGEGVLAGALEIALGGDGTSSELSGPSGFVWMLDAAPIGTLVRKPLPFAAPDDAAPSTLAALGARVLPASARAAIARRTAPHGWCLTREARAHEIDPWLAVGAAVMMVELAQW